MAGSPEIGPLLLCQVVRSLMSCSRWSCRRRISIACSSTRHIGVGPYRGLTSVYESFNDPGEVGSEKQSHVATQAPRSRSFAS